MGVSLLSGRAAGAVHLVGGRLCLDFINSVGGRRVSASEELTIRDEQIGDYLDLLAWGRHAGVLTAREAESLARRSLRRKEEAGYVFGRAVELREALYGIFRAILLQKKARPLQLRVLNEEMRLASAAEHLVFEKAHFAWQWRASDPSLDRVVCSVARSAAEVLTQSDLTRLRQCAGDDCGWIFEDTSRNRSRRWCEMRDCGNVAKVRRFRQRQQQNRMAP